MTLWQSVEELRPKAKIQKIKNLASRTGGVSGLSADMTHNSGLYATSRFKADRWSAWLFVCLAAWEGGALYWYWKPETQSPNSQLSSENRLAKMKVKLFFLNIWRGANAWVTCIQNGKMQLSMTLTWVKRLPSWFEQVKFNRGHHHAKIERSC